MSRKNVLAGVHVTLAVVFFVSGLFCALYEVEEWRPVRYPSGFEGYESYYRRPYSDLAGLLLFVSLLFLGLGFACFVGLKRGG